MALDHTDSMQLIDALIAEPSLYRDDFGSWLLDNWSIWIAFELRASRLWKAGVKHAGARMIGENIRYLTMLREKNSEFKVNDHWWPDLARLYMRVHPERDGFFETRVAGTRRMK